MISSNTKQQELLGDNYSAFIIEVEIESLIVKHWFRFKASNTYIIDNIAYQDLMRYQYAKMTIADDICWDSGYIDNTNIVFALIMLRIT
jgi:hypothetical protein